MESMEDMEELEKLREKKTGRERRENPEHNITHNKTLLCAAGDCRFVNVFLCTK